MTDPLYDASLELPHYHPCGHCKQRLNTWPCFTDNCADLPKHEGIYHLCEQCDAWLDRVTDEYYARVGEVPR